MWLHSWGIYDMSLCFSTLRPVRPKMLEKRTDSDSVHFQRSFDQPTRTRTPHSVPPEKWGGEGDYLHRVDILGRSLALSTTSCQRLTRGLNKHKGTWGGQTGGRRTDQAAQWLLISSLHPSSRDKWSLLRASVADSCGNISGCAGLRSHE